MQTLPAATASSPDIMYGLVLEDGERWGNLAIDQQIDDIEAIFATDGPNKHFITRPRGGSKTTDLAGVAVSWLAGDAPPRSRGYVVASNGEQAGILIDAAGSLVANTPELSALRVENERIIGPNDSWVRVLNLSDSGAWGLRGARILICDEFCQWPETRGAKRVYTAIRTTVQKVPGCKLVILSSSGEPSHWSRPIYIAGKNDANSGWRVSDMPGPVPWQDPKEIEELRDELTPSEFDRLVLNIWSEDEDRAVSEEDFEKAKQPARADGKGWRIRDVHPHIQYIETIDIGIVNDATVFCISHKESLKTGDRTGPKRVVIDHLERWAGSKKEPIQLDKVEDRAAELAIEFNKARVYADPNQFVGNLQSLNKRGIHAEQWDFTAASVGSVATALVQAFRNEQIHVPDVKILKDELLRVRLRESAPGVTRLDHDRSGHDDQAVVIGMATHIWLGKLGLGPTAAFRERMEQIKEQRAADNPVTGDTGSVTAARVVRRHFGMLQKNHAKGTRMRERQISGCVHRWRLGADGVTRCVFECGTVKDAA